MSNVKLVDNTKNDTICEAVGFRQKVTLGDSESEQIYVYFHTVSGVSAVRPAPQMPENLVKCRTHMLVCPISTAYIENAASCTSNHFRVLNAKRR